MKEMIRGLKTKIKRNKKLLYFLGGLAVIGLISGSFFLTFIRAEDQNLVKEYMTSFVESVRTGNLNYFDTFKNAIFSNFGYSITIFILGISIIGIPILLLLYFIKSFMIGFSISAFVFTFGIKGSILSFFYMIPHFINFIFYTVLLIFAMKISILLIHALFGKKEVSLKKPVSKYVTYYIVVLVAIVCTSCMESFLVPVVMKQFLFLIS